MKKKILILLLSVIAVICFAAGFAACSLLNGEKEVYSTLEMEEGIVYLTDFSMRYTSEEESPYGDIDESSLEESKTGSVQSYYMVMEFDMQTASDIEGMEYLTIELTVLDADIVNTIVNYANTSSTEVKSSGGQTTLTAIYSLPDKANLIKNVQLIVELIPVTAGSTDITCTFSSDNKDVSGYTDEDITYTYTSSESIWGYTISGKISIKNTSLEYTLSSDGQRYTVTGIGSKSGTTRIKETYAGLPVTAIGSSAFYECTSLTGITIPDSVTSIGSSAFYGCTSLTDITIPDSVTSIGSSAFYGCTSLTSITMPKSLKKVGAEAFYKCSALEGVYIKDIKAWCEISFEHPLYDSIYSKDSTWSNPLYYAGNLYLNGELVTDLVLPDGLISVGDCAFCGCTSLTGITIPDSVTSIGNYAFGYCDNLADINMSDSILSIGYSAFFSCDALESITIPDSVTSMGYFAFCGCSILTDISIGSGVTSIGGSAFADCSKLKNIYIKDMAAWLGIEFGCLAYGETWGDDYAARFYGSPLVSSGTKALYLNGELVTALVIPDGITSIANFMFYNCTAITSVSIADSVTSVSEYAFYNCKSLESVYYNGTASGWAGISFDSSASNPLYYAGNLYINGELATDITIEGITNIGNYAFYNCTSLESITISDEVTSIGEYAFGSCTTLTSVTFEDTSGWYYTSQSGTFSDGTGIYDAALADSLIAAEYLASTYAGYVWYKQ